MKVFNIFLFFKINFIIIKYKKISFCITFGLGNILFTFFYLNSNLFYMSTSSSIGKINVTVSIILWILLALLIIKFVKIIYASNNEVILNKNKYPKVNPILPESIQTDIMLLRKPRRLLNII